MLENNIIMILNKEIKSINICNIYILLWVLYMFHWNNTELPAIAGFSNIFLGVNLLISIYCAVRLSTTGYESNYFKASNMLLLIVLLYGGYSIMFGHTHVIKFTGDVVKNGTYLIAVLRSFLPVYTIYYFTKKGYMTLNVLKVWSLILLFVAVIIYYYSYHLHTLISDREEFTNNTSYVLLTLFPFVFLFDKKVLIQYVYVAIISIFVLAALKRGAIFIAVILLIYFFFFFFKNATSSQRYLFYAASIAFVIIGYRYLNTFMANSDLFQTRLQATLEGNSSGRDSIIQNLMHYFWNDAGALGILFGSGADSTLDIGENYAHNDWIEILINQGILGFIIYFYYWKNYFKVWQKSKHNTIVYEVIGANFVLYFAKGFFSMSYSMLPLAFALTMGYSLAKLNDYESELN